MIAQGAQAVVAFLAATLDSGVALHEAKVVLVGEGAVGKTSLRSWLLEGRYRRPEASTRALEVGSRELPLPADPARAMRLNVWDFGGQDEYRPSQQLFFTAGALYLLLWKGREGLAAGKVVEWLRLVRLRAGDDARVLMVSTFTEANDPPPNLNDLPEELRRMVVGPFQIDSPSGRGVEALLQRISEEVTRLPGFGAPWPREWIAARDAVLAHGRDGGMGKPTAFVPYAEFLRLCAPHRVTGDNAQTLARALSLQGRLDYKGDGESLDELVILSPEWLMKAIAYVISDPPTHANKGVLAHARLDPIWLTHARDPKENPERYERHLWGSLLRMMDEHEIVYQLTESEWVVPQLVPDAPALPPERMWTIADGPDEHDAGAPPAMRLDCDLDHRVRGLMALLTVRNHYHHVDRNRYFWQRGVFLRHPHTLAEGLVQVDHGENRVRIETRGQFGHDLMIELASSLERVIGDMWPGTRHSAAQPYSFHIPCPVKGCRGRFGQADLLRDLHKERTTADCVGGGRHSHDIRQLLGVAAWRPDALARIEAQLARMDAGMRGGFATLRGYVSSEAPRIIEIEPAEGRLDPRNLIQTRFRVRILCEETKTVVDGAEDVLAIPQDWWVAIRPWVPVALAAGKAIWNTQAGMPFGKLEMGDTIAPGRDDALAGEIGAQTGVLVRPDGHHLLPALKERVIAIAKKGGMKQIQMDSDGRWVWVSPAVARRADRSQPKE